MCDANSEFGLPINFEFAIGSTVLVLLSLISGLTIILTYKTILSLRKHPYNLIFRQSLASFLGSICFALLILSESVCQLQTPEVMGYMRDGLLFPLWFASSVFLAGSLGFSWLIAASLIMSIWLPFSDGEAMKKFCVPVYVLSVVSTSIRAAVDNGPGVLLRQYSVQWEQFLPIACTFLLNILAVIFAVIHFRQLSKSFKYKKRIIVQMCIFSLFFGITWGSIMARNIAYLVGNAESDYGEWINLFRWWQVYGMLCQGLLAGIIWLTIPTLRRAIGTRCCGASDSEYEAVDSNTTKSGMQYPKTPRLYIILQGIIFLL
eukprot:TRINITY_DN6057_c0_g1_i1.p1 TRINITY_DN6057_c0_g1~~TRINITY_DN6057_c0_g1_i1.p1  ORF type:complete len:318 (-),score=0.10 TRINITY_DN6057_c0_g1_i1:22-975(-)